MLYNESCEFDEQLAVFVEERARHNEISRYCFALAHNPNDILT
jgi:hypothetical protein